jgi:hypothetical protein
MKANKSKNKEQTKAKKKVTIKDLPAKSAREDAVRGGADPINGARIKKL